jgi:hypothetical protein
MRKLVLTFPVAFDYADKSSAKVIFNLTEPTAPIINAKAVAEALSDFFPPKRVDKIIDKLEDMAHEIILKELVKPKREIIVTGPDNQTLI